MNYVYNTISVILCLFVLIAVNTTWLEQRPSLAVFAALGLTLVFLNKPLIGRWKGSWWVRGIDWSLITLTFAVFGYIFFHSADWFSSFWTDGASLEQRAGNEGRLDFIVGGLGVLLVLEGTRRAIGWTLPILSLIFIGYALFGQSMPDWAFPHRGFEWHQIAQSSFLQGGVFGVALRVMFFYVFLFVLFGTLLEQTGATAYVINFAKRMFQRSVGGPAKVAVVSSGLMGSLSGSAVANTATTGTFTIPLMKSSGFSADAAGGVEAAASSGGALMPPIMGAGAYMMLELVPGGLEYVDIIQAALLPAIMYYMALLLTVHFHAKRIGASTEVLATSTAKEDAVGTTGAMDQQADVEASLNVEAENDRPKDEADALKQLASEPPTLNQGMVFVGSFIILIVMLLYRFTPFYSVSVGLVGVVFLSWLSGSTRLTPRKALQACVSAARSGVALIVAASCVGIILAVVNSTGFGNALPPKILALAGSSMLAALLLMMVSTIVLGMGLPSAVCYLLMATLIEITLNDLDTPPLAAHLFIFYFGMMSMVTPPVALAAYAAAAISSGDVIRTAFQAFRFALVGFALPFYFVLNPELLMLTQDNEPAGWLAIGQAVLIVSIAIYGLAAALAGQARGRLNMAWRTILFLPSLAIFFTRGTGDQAWIQLSLAGALLVVLVFEAVRARD